MVCFTLRVRYTVLLEGIVCLAMEMVCFAVRLWCSMVLPCKHGALFHYEMLVTVYTLCGKCNILASYLPCDWLQSGNEREPVQWRVWVSSWQNHGGGHLLWLSSDRRQQLWSKTGPHPLPSLWQQAQLLGRWGTRRVVAAADSVSGRSRDQACCCHRFRFWEE